VTWEQVGLSILGGFIAAAAGLFVWWVQHRSERADEAAKRQAAALRKLVQALVPALLELERFLSTDGKWVGRGRELPSLGTWILDEPSDPNAPPDWDSFAELTQRVERLWWDELQLEVYDPRIREAYGEVSRTALHLARRDAGPREGAVLLRDSIIRLNMLVSSELERVAGR